MKSPVVVELIEDVMLDILYEFPNQPDLEEFTVTADVVKHKTFGRGRKAYKSSKPAKKKAAKKKGREIA